MMRRWKTGGVCARTADEPSGGGETHLSHVIRRPKNIRRWTKRQKKSQVSQHASHASQAKVAR